MTFLNISQAARAAGVSRSKIYRLIKSGDLSAKTDFDEHGDPIGKLIDPSELLRVFGELKGNGDSKKDEQVNTVSNSVPDHLDTGAIRQTEHVRTGKKTVNPGIINLYNEYIESLKSQLQGCKEEFKAHILSLEQQVESLKEDKERFLSIIEGRLLIDQRKLSGQTKDRNRESKQGSELKDKKGKSRKSKRTKKKNRGKKKKKK